MSESERLARCERDVQTMLRILATGAWVGAVFLGFYTQEQWHAGTWFDICGVSGCAWLIGVCLWLTDREIDYRRKRR